MGADVLATQGARVSATMVFTMLNQNNLFPACQELTQCLTENLKTAHLMFLLKIPVSSVYSPRENHTEMVSGRDQLNNMYRFQKPV